MHLNCIQLRSTAALHPMPANKQCTQDPAAMCIAALDTQSTQQPAHVTTPSAAREAACDDAVSSSCCGVKQGSNGDRQGAQSTGQLPHWDCQCCCRVSDGRPQCDEPSACAAYCASAGCRPPGPQDRSTRGTVLFSRKLSQRWYLYTLILLLMAYMDAWPVSWRSNCAGGQHTAWASKRAKGKCWSACGGRGSALRGTRSGAWPLPGALGATFPGDVQVLLEFRNGLSSRGDLEFSWQANSDPCDDNWLGVLCDNEVCTSGFLPGCEASSRFNPATAARMPGSPSRVGYSNVTGLLYSELGSVLNGQFISNRSNALIGTVSPALGRLERLRLLNLAGNLLSGNIPPELGELLELEQLLLASNVLHGVIPANIGNATSLTLLDVSNNILNGSLPTQLCNERFRASMILSGNLGLCGYVPPCLAPRTLGIMNTALVSPTSSSNSLFYQEIGACCGATRPSCSYTNGCGVAVPRYWTNVSVAEFAFTPFVPPDGAAGQLEYYWTWSTSDKEPNQQAPQDGLYRRVNMSEAVVGPLNQRHANQPPSTNPYWWPDASGVPVQAPSNVIFYKFNVPFLDNLVLTEGVAYYIYVFGVNSSCPNARAPSVSAAATVIVTGPRGGEVIVNHNQGTQRVTDSITFVYRNFTDSFLNASTLRYQYDLRVVEDGSGGGELLKGPIDITGMSDRPIIIGGLALKTATKYMVTVSATNLAGRVGNASAAVLVDVGNGESIRLALGLSLGLVALFTLLTAIGVLWFLRRHKQQELARMRERGQLKSLRTLVTGMSNNHFVKLQDLDDALAACPALCFVVTDLENSTGMAAADKEAYNQLLQLHDMIMREYINRHNGYEISTEGDSFNIAFLKVEQAIQFCMDVQHRLIETNWPFNVLQLPTCKPIHDDNGELLFNGPRVRMGIHFAPPMTVFPKKHPHTQHWEFKGPGFQLAKELGDAAAGGQVLMTDWSWLELSQVGMDKAGFPIVYQIGRFQLPGAAQPSFLYEVQGQLGRMLGRKFVDNPRGIIKVGDGLGYDLGIPPIAHGMTLKSCNALHKPGDELAFVGCRLVPPVRDAVVPEGVQTQLRNMLDMCAQQYGGYMFHEHIDAWIGGTACRWYYAFADVLHAVRFAHVSQMCLMTDRWDAWEHSSNAWGPEEQTPDGRLLFRGPRVAMGITYTYAYSEEDVPSSCPEFRDPDVKYVGEGVRVLSLLVGALHGGQVVLDQAAWGAVHEVLPLQAQTIDLGVFRWPPDISDSTDKMQLMEVMPSMLNYRTFGPLCLLTQLEPGYRESPDPCRNMVIMFVKVVKPRDVTDALVGIKGQATDATAGCTARGYAGCGCADEPTSMQDPTKQKQYRILTAWNIAMSGLHCVVRDLLRELGGYECKEPEAGKFTLAFRDLRQALLYSSAVQIEMVRYDWGEEVLQLQQCGPQRDTQGRILWRGPRIKVGMAYGMPTLRKVLNTGRADYFGALPNLAARVMALARPGQSLLDVSKAAVAELDKLIMQQVSASRHHHAEPGHLLDGTVPEVQPEHADYSYQLRIWGKFGAPELKGVPDERLIAMVMPRQLHERCFESPRPAAPKVHTSFRSYSARRSSLAATMQSGNNIAEADEEIPSGCAGMTQLLNFRRMHQDAMVERERHRNKLKVEKSSLTRAMFRRQSMIDPDYSDASDEKADATHSTSNQRSNSSGALQADEAMLAAAAAAVASEAPPELGDLPPGHLLRVPLARISAMASLRRPSQHVPIPGQGPGSMLSAGESDDDAPVLNIDSQHNTSITAAAYDVTTATTATVHVGAAQSPSEGLFRDQSTLPNAEAVNARSATETQAVVAPQPIAARNNVAQAGLVWHAGSVDAARCGSPDFPRHEDGLNVCAQHAAVNAPGTPIATPVATAPGIPQPERVGTVAQLVVDLEMGSGCSSGGSPRVHRVDTQRVSSETAEQLKPSVPNTLNPNPSAQFAGMIDLVAGAQQLSLPGQAGDKTLPTGSSSSQTVHTSSSPLASSDSGGFTHALPLTDQLSFTPEEQLPTPFLDSCPGNDAPGPQQLQLEEVKSGRVAMQLSARCQPATQSGGGGSGPLIGSPRTPLGSTPGAAAQEGRCTRMWFDQRPVGLGIIDESAKNSIPKGARSIKGIRRLSWEGRRKNAKSSKSSRRLRSELTRAQSEGFDMLRPEAAFGSVASRKVHSGSETPSRDVPVGGSFTSATASDGTTEAMSSPMFAKESYDRLAVRPIPSFSMISGNPSHNGSVSSSRGTPRTIRISSPDENTIRNAGLEAQVTIEAQRHMHSAMLRRQASKVDALAIRRRATSKNMRPAGSAKELRGSSPPRAQYALQHALSNGVEPNGVHAGGLLGSGVCSESLSRMLPNGGLHVISPVSKVV